RAYPLDTERASQTAGIWAYRHNGRYFRTALFGYADPHNAGQYLANRIPKDAEEREKWIKQIINLIENELQWRTEQGIAATETVHPGANDTRSRLDIALDHAVDDRRQIAFMDIVPDYDLDWLWPKFYERGWTYVIDLQDRAFTIDGILHFAFDTMPRNIPQCLVRPTICATYYKATPEAEALYSTFVQRWPPSLQKPAEDHVDTYSQISPIVTNLEEWGARAWDGLNASEALAVHLVATILQDQSTQIRNPDFIGDRRMFTYCQWQILTAAAPSAAAFFPMLNSSSVPLHPGIHLTLEESRSDPRMTFEFMQGLEKAEVGDWVIPPIWFRGCLIKLCHRLDTPEFMMAEVHQMVRALQASIRNEGLGLIFDGRNVVGVALDNARVRHSPVLPIYNHQLRLMDGFRLMMHLLSPCVLTNKTPWRASAPRPSQAALALPMEIIVRITQFLDSDAYGLLPLVSYSFRQLYFTYPRFGDIILLQPSQKGSFYIFNTVEQRKHYAYFFRHTIGLPASSFGFYHHQRKLGPIFFTPEEYTESRARPKATGIRHVIVPTLVCPMLTHIFRLCLQVPDEGTPESSESLKQEDTGVSMQVVEGRWSFQETLLPEEDEVWYLDHIAGPAAGPISIQGFYYFDRR
ncbi:hypothetical protein FRC11_012846, partial [Ceratobasidium sp. 423]